MRLKTVSHIHQRHRQQTPLATQSLVADGVASGGAYYCPAPTWSSRRGGRFHTVVENRLLPWWWGRRRSSQRTAQGLKIIGRCTWRMTAASRICFRGGIDVLHISYSDACWRVIAHAERPLAQSSEHDLPSHIPPRGARPVLDVARLGLPRQRGGRIGRIIAGGRGLVIGGNVPHSSSAHPYFY